MATDARTVLADGDAAVVADLPKGVDLLLQGAAEAPAAATRTAVDPAAAAGDALRQRQQHGQSSEETTRREPAGERKDVADGNVRVRRAQTQDPPAESTPVPPPAGDPVAGQPAAADARNPDGPTASAHPPTIARAPTTPCFVSLLLPLVCLATHALFYYGQTAAMWKLRLYADVDVWANATSYIARQTFNTAGIEHRQEITFYQDQDVNTFTYWYAIKELWRGKGIASKTLPRIAAGLLVVFSGIWPHLKLLLLNITFLCSRGGVGRTRTLSGLGTLGKWSLADVLTVCVMVGVLHLDWDVDPTAIKHGVIDNLPEILTVVHALYPAHNICDYLLHWECNKQRKVERIAKCKTCQTFMHTVFNKPDWAKTTGREVARGISTSGGGLVTLRVQGMAGIYAFSGAVILSIFLSILVDWYDHKAHLDDLRRQQVADRLQDFLDSHPLDLREPLMQSVPKEDESPLQSPLEMEAGLSPGSSSARRTQPQRRDGSRYMFSWVYIVVTAGVLYAVYKGVTLTSMERQVKGAGPKMLHDVLGLDLGLSYSLYTLMETTGLAGGWDNLLMGTFSLFCVMGPIVRAGLCSLVGVLDKVPFLRHSVAVPMTTAINFVGAFCAWEVLVIAIVMVDMLMPTITDTIVQSPICGEITEDGSCLHVEFNILIDSFRWIVGGGIILLGTSWVAANNGNKMQRERCLARPEEGGYMVLSDS